MNLGKVLPNLSLTDAELMFNQKMNLNKVLPNLSLTNA
jgi:hypothetical protein